MLRAVGDGHACGAHSSLPSSRMQLQPFAATVHCNAQGRAAKGTLEKCTNDQLKSWLRAKVGGLLGGSCWPSPGCAPRWVGCWGAAAGPVLAAHHGGLSGNITSWSLCGAPRIRRLQGMQIMVWHPVHHPANCCCAGPEADGQQEGAGGPHPAAPGHWTVAATVSTHTRVHLPCGSNESMRHPASIPSSVPKRRGAAPRFAPGLPACNFAAHTDSAACNVHVQSCKVLILPLNASSSWIA